MRRIEESSLYFADYRTIPDVCGFTAIRYYYTPQTFRRWRIYALKRSPRSSTTTLIQVSFSPRINITVTAPFRDSYLHQLPQDADGFGSSNVPPQNSPRMAQGKLSSLDFFLHLVHNFVLQYIISPAIFAGEGTHLWS